MAKNELSFQSWEEVERHYLPQRHSDLAADRKASTVESGGLDMVPLIAVPARTQGDRTLDRHELPLAGRTAEVASLRERIDRIGDRIDRLLAEANRSSADTDDQESKARRQRILGEADALMEEQSGLMRSHATRRMHLPLGEGRAALRAAEELLKRHEARSNDDGASEGP